MLILSGCATDGLKPTGESPAQKESNESIAGTAVVLVAEDVADGFEDMPRTKAFDAIGIERIERVFPDAGSSRSVTAPPACTAGTASPMILPSPRPRQAKT